MNWKKVPLGQVAPYITTKVDAIHLNASNYVSADNMEVDRGGITDSAYAPVKGRATSFEKGDILVSNIRPYFKKIWHAKFAGGCSNDVFVLRAKDNLIDQRFLYYTLSKQDFFDFMMAGANGTKMPRGNKNAIPNYLLGLPPLPTQRKIASILSAYDDLIENNLKRIKLLEEKAQLMYEEWFVRMRFPGHENVQIDEESGLPEGWEKVKIKDTSIKIGDGNYSSKYPRSKDFISIGVPFFSTKEIVNGRLSTEGVKRISIAQHNTLLKGHLVEGDIVLSTRGSIGKVAFVDKAHQGGNINAQLALFRCDNSLIFSSFLYYQLSHHNSYKMFLNVGTGTAQPQLPIKTLHLFEILNPISTLQQQFHQKVHPQMQLIASLLTQNQLLKEARDILLPRLMKGVIDVTNKESIA